MNYTNIPKTVSYDGKKLFEIKQKLSDFPEDAQIFCVGTFDDHSGVITPENTFVCTGLDLKKEDKHE